LEDIGLFSSSSDISWEVLPVGVKEIPTNFPGAKVMAQDRNTTVTKLPALKGEEARFGIQASKTTDALVNIFYFPSWQIELDGKPLAARVVEKSGVVKVNIPAGEHILSLKLVSTPIQNLANKVSFISVFLLFTILTLERKKIIVRLN
jgi:hypothetical protein